MKLQKYQNTYENSILTTFVLSIRLAPYPQFMYWRKVILRSTYGIQMSVVYSMALYDGMTIRINMISLI
jgi:hypothetical protein